ncbi:MAG: N-acetylneuraminate lyase [Sodalis sp.]|nr:MAG: N-acetylneuraminate lyase [Sodalis sp.]
MDAQLGSDGRATTPLIPTKTRYGSLCRLVHFNINQGVSGLYVGGSTGEAFSSTLPGART